MSNNKKIKKHFSSRNRIIYFVSGIICLVTSFLPFYSFYYDNFFIRFIGIDVISDIKAINLIPQLENKNSIITLLLFLLPFYVMILGLVYLFRSIVMSYEIEKYNNKVFKVIKSITGIITISWCISVVMINTHFDNAHFYNSILDNIGLGFYLFIISEVLKFFLEITIDEEDEFIVNKQKNVFYEEIYTESPLREFYINDGLTQTGPFSIKNLEGKLNNEIYVWQVGMGDWVLASKIPELEHLITLLPPIFNLIKTKQAIIPPAFNVQLEPPIFNSKMK